MQRILQINIAGRVLPIEEDAYITLREYINTLERQFHDDDGREIIEEIENRIAELFTIRLQGGSPAIDRADVQKVIETLGTANDLNDGKSESSRGYRRQAYTSHGGSSTGYSRTSFRLLRDPFDKVIGGVCSGIAHYFDIDPVIVRLIMVVLFLTAGIGFLAYIIAWMVIPAARTREELFQAQGNGPVTFHDISRNVEAELQDLRKRGEQMSRELKEFFSRKK